MPIPLNQATYECFSNFLENRIKLKQNITEDSVRYAFFYALMQSNTIEQHELIMELPHPTYLGKEVDTYIMPSTDRREIFLEFKFHRQAPRSTSGMPYKAGSLFKDVARLAAIHDRNNSCAVIYLTCPEMANYFERKKGSYSDFWRLQAGEEFRYDQDFLDKTTPTFRRESGELNEARVHIEFSKKLVHDYHLRIFDVQTIKFSS
jgi:hypothetical protein